MAEGGNLLVAGRLQAENAVPAVAVFLFYWQSFQDVAGLERHRQLDLSKIDVLQRNLRKV